jgi:hypothetical protein
VSLHRAPDGRQYAVWTSRDGSWAHMRPVRTAPLAAVRRSLDAAFQRTMRAPSSMTRRRFLGVVVPERPRRR